ncbi:MAG: hypothetical protein GC181_03400 [Bacteroidetes bacterium]|nr:hypothetical protein [Bacteroidota bacterium]
MILITFAYVSIRIVLKNDLAKHAVHADAAGYYSWLPAIFIYSDSQFAFCDSVAVSKGFYPTGSFSNIIIPVSDGSTMNKYAPGCALVSIPFFGVAHGISTLKGANSGFEFPYQFAWFLSSVFWVCAGIWFLFRLGSLTKKPVLIPLLVASGVVFGTNLFHYATFDAGYSHAFTFGWICIAYYYAFAFRIAGKVSALNFLALACGVLVLIRPFNIVLIPTVLIFIPWKTILQEKPKTLLIPGFIFSGFIFLYALSNYWQTGRFIIYSYGRETFDFANSHFIKFLFGFEIGAFIYSPLFLILIALSLYAASKSKSALLWLSSFVFFISISWLLSTWQTWLFGCTLGNRPLADWIMVFGCPLIAFWPVGIRKNMFVYMVWIPATLAGIAYSQILCFQYRNNILDWCAMNYEKFSDVFLQTNLDYAYYTSSGWDFSNTLEDSVVFETTVDSLLTIQGPYNHTLLSFEGLKMDSTKSYRFLFTCEVKFIDKKADNQLVAFINNGKDYLDFQRKFIKKDVRETGKWMTFKSEFPVPYASKELNGLLFSANNNRYRISFRNIRGQLISYTSP